MKVIITIPAYNEEKTLPLVLEEIKQVMQNTKYKYKILVLDDGSRDRTAEIAEKQGAIVVSHPRNRGLAETFREEMKECLKLGADIIVHTDADGQYHPQHIPELIQKVESGYDLVLGSRFRGKIEQMPLLKKIGNIAFSIVLTSLTNVRITDSTTGFRAFTAEVASEINYINTFTYTQEQIIKATKQGFRIAEVPIQTRRTRSSRLFKNPLQYALKAWINIFRIYRDYEPLMFFGRIGLLGLSFGGIIGFYFVFLHFTSGIKGHLGLLFLMMILLVFGLQTVLFGFLADMMRKD
ncbi:MAG: family 2 glycosyl transferase [archaeon GW2011_AR9]|nr:MAG: family 2 glycosyl transferase [archaeon GW2011_AR9]MBS3120658.1 glycosyltransferase family 2 protein [Candidatus Woesearchaeota archaeon]HIG92854.1 glycosyltransferase family 2 protein [Candidatus Woesearchaeota archaeon]HIH13006.1 glycosyltransferase family 2 protein [Candidatus Woesearchaeota archaeon]